MKNVTLFFFLVLSLGFIVSITDANAQSCIPKIAIAPSNGTICSGAKIDLQDTISQPIYVGNLRTWHFGDGSISVEPNPKPHTYVNFSDTIKIVRGFLLTRCPSTPNKPDSTFFTVRILPTPKPDFELVGGDTACSIIGNVCINNLTEDSLGLNNFFNWDLGDGSTTADTNPCHKYFDPGTFSIRLSVRNTYGCSQTASRNVFVKETPNTNFSIMGNDFAGCLPLTVDFLPDTTPSATPVIKWEWDFGNGEKDTIPDPPPFTYETVDTFFVKLTETNELGCVNTLIQPIFVGPRIEVELRGPRVVCPNTLIKFSAFSTQPDSIDSFTWTLTNGIIAGPDDDSTLFVQFDSAGIQSIIVKANAGGCGEEDTIQVEVLEVPTVEIQADPPPYCRGDTVNVKIQPPAATYYVYNGVFSTDSSLTFINIQKDTTVGVLVIDTNGCQLVPDNNDSIRIRLQKAPQVDIISDPGLLLCQGDSVRFRADVLSGNIPTFKYFLDDSLVSQPPFLTEFYTIDSLNADSIKVYVEGTDICGFTDRSPTVWVKDNARVTVPVVNCGPSTALFTSFIWNSQLNTNNYRVVEYRMDGSDTTFIDSTSTSRVVTGLNEGDSISLIVTALGPEPCNYQAVSNVVTCYADTCAQLGFDKNVITSLCETDSVNLVLSNIMRPSNNYAFDVEFGSFSASSKDSVFKFLLPSGASSGFLKIKLTDFDEPLGCRPFIDSVNITISEEANLIPSVVTCTNSDSTSFDFDFSNVTGATNYTITPTYVAGDSTPVVTTDILGGQRFGSFSNLQPNDTVIFDVTAIGPPPCSSTVTTSATCITCPTMDFDLIPGPVPCDTGLSLTFTIDNILKTPGNAYSYRVLVNGVTQLVTTNNSFTITMPATQSVAAVNVILLDSVLDCSVTKSYVYNRPTAVVTSAISQPAVCPSDTLTLTLTPATLSRYVFSEGSVLQDGSSNTLTLNGVGGQRKIGLLAYDSLGCPFPTDSIFLNPQLPPNIGLNSSNPNICDGSLVNFFADISGLNSYNWQSDTGLIQTSTSNFFTLSNFTLTDLNVWVAAVNSCKDTSYSDTIRVTKIENTITPPVITCNPVDANTVQFAWDSIVGATRYEISVNGGAYINKGSDLIHNVAVPQGDSAIAVVRAFSGAPCNYSATSAPQKCFPCDVVNFSANVTPNVCLGDSVTLSFSNFNLGSGSYTVVINDGSNIVTRNNFNDYRFLPNLAGSYKVYIELTDNGNISAGCPGVYQDSLTYIVSPNTLGTPVLSCGSRTKTSVTYNWSDVAGATDYQINVGGVIFKDPSTGTLGLSHTETGLTPGSNISARVRASATLCSAVSTLSNVQSCPTCPDVNFDLEWVTVPCQSGNVAQVRVINVASPYSSNNFSYNFSDNLGGNGNTNNNLIPATVVPSNVNTVTITVQLLDSNALDCPVEKSITYTRPQSSSISYNYNANPVCSGSNVIVTVLPTTFSNYRFSAGGVDVQDGTSNILNFSPVNTDTNIRVFVEDAFGCEFEGDLATINTIKPGPVSLSADKNLVCQGQSIAFTASMGSFTTYRFFYEGGLVQSSSNNTYFVSSAQPDTADMYVEAVNACGDVVTSNMVKVPVRPDFLATPQVNCGSTGFTFVTFEWDSIPGAIDYEISINNGIFNSPNGSNNTSHTITGLAPNNFRSAVVRAIGDSPCDNVSVSVAQTCQAIPCSGIDFDIDYIQNQCIGGAGEVSLSNFKNVSAQYSLTYNVNGSNVLTSKDSTFIAGPLGNGVTTVTVTLVDSATPACPSVVKAASFQVIPGSDTIVPPVVNCGNSDTSFVTFNWNPVPGAIEYRISINGQNAVVPSSGPLGTSHIVSGLTSGDEVRAAVNVIGGLPCSPFNTSDTVSCFATECPGIDFSLAPVSPVCEGETVAVNVIGLSAEVSGSFNLSYQSLSDTVNTQNLSYNFGPLNAGPNGLRVVLTDPGNPACLPVVKTINVNAIAEFNLAKPTIIAATSTTNSINYTWAPINNAVDYLVSVNNGNFVSAGNVTNYSVTPVAPGDSASLRVIAVGPIPCQSISDTSDALMHFAKTCPNVNFTVSTDPNLCQGDFANIFVNNLQNLPPNYSFSVSGGVTSVTAISTPITYGPLNPGTDNVLVSINDSTNIGCGPYSKNLNLQSTPLLNNVSPAIVNCFGSDTNNITFSWDAVNNATSYQVSIDGGAFVNPSTGSNGTLHAISGLNQGDTSRIVVRTIRQGPCNTVTSLSNEATCYTNICPPLDFSVSAPSEFCPGGNVMVSVSNFLNVSPQYSLSFTYNGNTTITKSTNFNMGPLSVGANTVSITLEDSANPGCPVVTKFIEVIGNPNYDTLPKPQVNCGQATLNSVNFTWDAIIGATSYQISTDGGVIWQNPSGATSHLINGLNPGQSVDLQVKAIGAPPCSPEAVSDVVTCLANDCPALDFDLVYEPFGCEGGSNAVKLDSLKNYSINYQIQFVFNNDTLVVNDTAVAVFNAGPLGLGNNVVTVTAKDLNLGSNCPAIVKQAIIIGTPDTATTTLTLKAFSYPDGNPLTSLVNQSCEGDSVRFVVEPDVYAQYDFYRNGTLIGSSDSNSILLPLPLPGQFNFKAIGRNFGCISDSTNGIIMFAIEKPDVFLSISSNSTICNPSGFTLTASPSSFKNYTFNVNDTVFNNGSLSILNRSYLDTVVANVEIETETGCNALSNTVRGYYPNVTMSLNIIALDVVDPCDSALQQIRISFNASVSTNGNQPVLFNTDSLTNNFGGGFSWSNGANGGITSLFAPNDLGTTISGTYTSAQGCQFSTQSPFTLTKQDIDFPVATTITSSQCYHESLNNGISLRAPDSLAFFKWLRNPYFGETQDSLVNFTLPSSGIYDFILRQCSIDSVTCCNQRTYSVCLGECVDPFVPTGISPNNDGQNDHLEIGNIAGNLTVSLKVFNRWGGLVYQDDAYNNNWKGTSSNGSDLPDGVYFVIVKVEGQRLCDSNDFDFQTQQTLLIQR